MSTFSRGRHQRYLEASGLNTEEAEQTTATIYDQMLAAGVTSISTCQLGYLTYLCLDQEIGGKQNIGRILPIKLRFGIPFSICYLAV